jgi:histone deacetylase complex regulatory component SIN3
VCAPLLLPCRRKAREDMNKLWRKVYDQNYHKSLDHRSFYFKQADKKALAPKAMLQEVRSSRGACVPAAHFSSWDCWAQAPAV